MNDTPINITNSASSSWLKTTLGVLIDKGFAHLQTGPFGTALHASDYSKTGVPVVAVKNIRENKLVIDTDTPRIDGFALERLSSYQLRNGDILFGRKGAIERRAIVTENEVGYLQGSDCIRLRFLSSDIFAGFISYAFGAPWHKSWMLSNASGSTMPSLNQDILRRIPLLIPSLPEQRKIAAILSTWDEAIERTERLIAALQARKKGLTQKLLTGEVRYPKLIKTSEKQETSYGTIPADWAYIPVSEVARQVSQRNDNHDDLPVLSCTKYDGLVDSLTYFGRQIFSEDTSTYKVVMRGQFAYATNHIEEGSIGYQSLYDRALISPMYTVFETNGKVDDSFLYKLLKTELYRHIFEVNTSASVDRRGSLRWNVFSQIKIPLPQIEEQKAIAQVLETCEEEIELTKRRLETLKQQKKGLMQKLLTGEVRVKVEE